MEIKFTLPTLKGKDEKYNSIVLNILMDALHLSTRYLKTQDMLTEDQYISILTDACSKSKYSVSSAEVKKILDFMHKRNPMIVNDMSFVILHVILYKEKEIEI